MTFLKAFACVQLLLLFFLFRMKENKCNILDLASVKTRCKWKVLFRAAKGLTDGDSKTASSEQFSEIFEQYFDKVYKFFYFRLRNEHDAEDLAAETFEKILKNLSAYEDRGYQIGAWIFTIARNVMNDFFRKNKMKVDSIDEMLPSKEPAKEFDMMGVDRKMLKEQLWDVVKTLPPKQQTIWSLKLTEDLPHKNIAEVLGTTEANVNVMVHRSVKIIKQQLSHLYYES